MPASLQPALPEALRARLHEDEALVRLGRLDAACRSRLWPAQGPARGVCLLLHGFTAGPWQFAELGPKLAAGGLWAYAARLPGHGARVYGKDGHSVEDATGLPKSRQAQGYGQRARGAWAEALALATQHRLPLTLVGHSAGGAMAMDLLRHPDAQVQRAALVAPLLRPKRRMSYLFVQFLGRLPGVGPLTDFVRLSWPKPVLRPDGWVRPGHRQFRLGNVVSLFRYANQTRRALQALACNASWLPPLQLVCTACDDKVDLAACQNLAASAPDRHALFCFGPEHKVPHAMLTAWENPNTPARERVHTLLLQFLLEGRQTR